MPEKIGLQAVFEDRQFIDGVEHYSKTVIKITKETGTAAEAMKKTGKEVDSLGKIAKTVAAGGLALLSNRLVRAGAEMITTGANALQMRDSFQEMARQAGGSADEILSAIQRATDGTISEMDAMAAANRGILLGLGAQADQWEKLTEVARFRARAMGITVTQAMNDIATGIGRQSKMILDNLGIILDLDQVYGTYAASIGVAASALDEYQKKQAITNAVIEDGQKMIAEAGGLSITAAEKVQRLTAATQDLKMAWSELAAEVATEPLEGITESVKAITAAMEGEDAEFAHLSARQVKMMADIGGASQNLRQTQESLRREQERLSLAFKAGIGAYDEYQKSMEPIIRETGVLTQAELQLERGVSFATARAVTYNQQLRDMAGETALTAEETKALKGDVDALADAYDKAADMLADFIGALGSGIVNIQGLDAAAVQSSKDYEKAVRDLERQAGQSYASIAEKYESSLPDPTTVQDRLSMTGDAWDEWALRMGALMDGIQGTQEQGWLDTLTAMTAGTDLAFRAGEESLSDWMARLKEAFYAGDLQGLINEDAAAWQEHATTVAAAQQSETATVAAETAKRKAALAEEAAAAEAAASEARQRAMLEMSLDLAEASGMLQAWAAETFGPNFATAFDTAAEVLSGLDSGLIPFDTKLQEILGGLGVGIQTVMDELGGAGDDVESTFGAAMTNVEAEIARAAEEMDKKLDLAAMLPPEDAAAAGLSMGEGLTSGLEEADAPATIQSIFGAFDTAVTNSITTTSGLKDALDKLPEDVELKLLETGFTDAINKARELLSALDNLPKNLKIHVEVIMDLPEEAKTNSPHTNMEYALDNLVNYVRRNFPLRVQMDMDLDMSEGWTEIAGSFGNDVTVMDMLHKFGQALQSSVEGLQAVLLYTGGLLDSGAAAFKEDLIRMAQVLAEAERVISTIFLGRPEVPTTGLSITELGTVLTTMLDAFSALGDYTRIGRYRIDQFTTDLGDIVDAFAEASDRWRQDVSQGRWFIEQLSFVGEALGPTLEGLAELSTYSSATDGQIQLLADDLVRIVDALAEAAGYVQNEGLSAATKLAAVAGVLGLSVRDAVEGLSMLTRYRGLSADSLQAFRRDLPAVVQAMVDIAAEFDAQGGVAAGQAFADASKSIASSVSQAVDALVDVARYRGGVAQYVPRFAEDWLALVQAVTETAALVSPADTERAAGIASLMAELASAVDNALDALIGVASYRGGIGQGMEAFINDLALLIEMFENLGEAIPPWLVPGSPTPFELGLRGIGQAWRQLPMGAQTVVSNTTNRTMQMNVGPVSLNNGMDTAGFQALIRQTVRQELM